MENSDIYSNCINLNNSPPSQNDKNSSVKKRKKAQKVKKLKQKYDIYAQNLQLK